MTTQTARVIAVVTSLCLSATLFTAATRFGTPPARAANASFTHVIIIVQENRTPDNLFQGLCAPPYGSPSRCSTTPGPMQYDIQTGSWADNAAPGGTIQPHAVTRSIVRFVEHNFGLAEGGLHFADSRSKTDLTGFFDFSKPPRSFQTIAFKTSSLTAAVMNDTSPPDDD